MDEAEELRGISKTGESWEFDGASSNGDNRLGRTLVGTGSSKM